MSIEEAYRKLKPLKPLYYTCPQCGKEFDQYAHGACWGAAGRRPIYCSNACKQRAYRERKKESFRRTYPTTDPA